MIKLLRRSLLGLILLFLLLCGGLWVLLGSQSGVQWLLHTADDFLPGTLQFESLQGDLLGELTLNKLRYVDAQRSMQLARLHLSWQPQALFSGVLHVRDLSIEHPVYAQLSETEAVAPTDSGTKSGPLPDLSLPLLLRLDHLGLSAMEFVAAPEAEPVRIDELQLEMNWSKDGIALSQLSVIAPQGRLDTRGHVQPVGDYPLDLSLAWRLTLDAAPQVHGQGQLAGDLRQLHLNQQMDGDLGAVLDLQASDLLAKLNWKLHLQVARFPALAGISAKDLQPLNAQITARGDLKAATAAIELTENAAEKPLALTLDADYQFQTQAFRLEGHWQDLRWPVAGDAQLLAPGGQLNLHGVADDYQIGLNLQLQGQGIPAGQWQLQGRGNTQTLALQALKASILDGQLKVSGDLAWSPNIKWKLNIEAKDINPGQLSKDWPGQLNLLAASEGSLHQGRPQLQLHLQKLSGSLNGKPVNGQGDFRILADSSYVLNDIKFSSGTATAMITGKVAKSLNLNWHLQVPDMADLLPTAKGQIQAQGTLSGTQVQPVLSGDLAVQSLRLDNLGVKTAQGDFKLGLDPAFDSHIQLNARSLDLSDQHIKTLSLQAKGPFQNQQIVLAVEHSDARMQLMAEGAFNEKTTTWNGNLSRLELDAGEELGRWHTTVPVPLVLSAQAQKISALCLQNEQASICADADLQDAQGPASLKLQHLSLQRLRPWLPAEIETLTGIVNLDAHARLGATTTAQLEAVVEPGELSYRSQSAHEVRLHHHDTRFTANYDKQYLQTHWELHLAQHTLDGELTVPRAELDRDPMSASLRGKVNVAVQDLEMLTVFVPDIKKIDGKIHAALQLNGTLGDPKITGQAVVDAPSVVIPRGGLELKDTKFTVSGKGGDQLSISGQFRSGQGSLLLNGKVLLDAQKGWPTQIDLKGENFQLANLPEAQVLITPDLKLEASQELIRLRGKLFVPVALISVNDLPPDSQSISGDVIVLEEGSEPEKSNGPRIDALVEIELGEQVHFNGLGLHVDLDGKLTIRQGDGKLPTANGELKILSGSFRAYGQDLSIEKGRIYYAGGRIDNPGLRLRASRKIDDIKVGVDLTGTAKKPEVNVFSTDPDVTTKDAVSMLITGQRSDDLANATVYAGRQITPKLSVGVNVGAGDAGTEFVTRYKLRDNVDVEATSSSRKSGVSIGYTFDIE